VKIKYLAHASFLITSQDGKKIITDPYNAGQGLNYGAIQESADIVTVSHGHGDHNNAKSVQGQPAIIQTAGEQKVNGIEIKGLAVYHDETQGSQRGPNIVFCFKVDGIRICHAGDLGHRLNPQQISALGQTDVLLIPVGGFYTLPVKEVIEVIRAIAPKMVIPMHYKTLKTDYPIAPVEEFLQGQKQVRRLNTSEIELVPGDFKADTEIVVLQPAL
jgi:L-ascorbate metabolism protein UlaG (beta-lactamase superfamily)